MKLDLKPRFRLPAWRGRSARKLKGIERASTNPWDGSNAEQQTTALNELLLTSTAQQFRNSIVPE
jgi:hypothetical protein